MARTTSRKAGKTRGGQRRSTRSGALRVRANVSARRSANTPQAREVRKNIDAAIAEGARLREEILKRIEDGLRAPAPRTRVRIRR